MMKIEVIGMSFYAFHGFYPSEQKIGQTFVVDVSVDMQMETMESDELSNTLNYELIYDICKAEMQCTQKLLETVCYRIAQCIQSASNRPIQGHVSILKPNVCLGGKLAGTRVTYAFE